MCSYNLRILLDFVYVASLCLAQFDRELKIKLVSEEILRELMPAFIQGNTEWITCNNTQHRNTKHMCTH